MFGEFVEARAGEAGRRSWAIVVSVTGQVVVLLLLVLVPLIYTEALPSMLQGMKALLAPPVVPLVEAPKPPPASKQAAIRRRRIVEDGVIHAPTFIPVRIAVVREPELPAASLPDADADYKGVDLFSYPGEGVREVAPPAAVMPLPTPRVQRSQIEPAMILLQPQPAYPPLARSARIQGDVLLHAIIDKEGRVAELEFVSGNPLLARAALDAVRTWRYRPTLLNGQPVEVETTITVSFVLGQ